MVRGGDVPEQRHSHPPAQPRSGFGLTLQRKERAYCNHQEQKLCHTVLTHEGQTQDTLLIPRRKERSSRHRCMRGTHLRRDTVIPQWFQASKAAAASDGHAVHC
jgi:hypothetical protein